MLKCTSNMKEAAMKLVSLLSVIVRNGSLRYACVRADISCATERIEGLEAGSVRAQASATFTTNTTSSANCPVGGGSRWSSTSFKNGSLPSSSPCDGGDKACREDRRSPGCFPNMTSSATTPKLYTSHFSVTLIV
ncbi:hypothetical protein MUK42_18801 [Musa troglodytarum]|uniref:Uncharacterized protein n=1 Tax=Musa troglodytarum TaxID=320322 RepID=A0A9E7EVT0_9LILI|nr:hypothetical protein MUK42_18801 [Musa troglodytarum]